MWIDQEMLKEVGSWERSRGGRLAQRAAYVSPPVAATRVMPAAVGRYDDDAPCLLLCLGSK
jgi:hypothetical protein